jgi:hypothetical protein
MSTSDVDENKGQYPQTTILPCILFKLFLWWWLELQVTLFTFQAAQKLYLTAQNICTSSGLALKLLGLYPQSFKSGFLWLKVQPPPYYYFLEAFVTK